MRKYAEIIAICGGSGSGKSTLARKFVGAAVVATDNFYRNLSELIANEDGSYNHDDPGTVDLEYCSASCLKLAQGEDAIIPVYNMKLAQRLGTQLIPAPANKMVVVEGIFAFHHPLSEIATLKIFIDTPLDQRLARRLRADIERGRSSLETIRHSLQVEEAYALHIEPMKQFADLVLSQDEIQLPTHFAQTQTQTQSRTRAQIQAATPEK